MISRNTIAQWRLAALAGTALAAVALVPQARADADADAKIAKLLDLLVQKKIVSSRQAKELFRETEGSGAAPARVARGHGAAGGA